MLLFRKDAAVFFFSLFTWAFREESFSIFSLNRKKRPGLKIRLDFFERLSTAISVAERSPIVAIHLHRNREKSGDFLSFCGNQLEFYFLYKGTSFHKYRKDWMGEIALKRE